MVAIIQRKLFEFSSTFYVIFPSPTHRLLIFVKITFSLITIVESSVPYTVSVMECLPAPLSIVYDVNISRACDLSLIY